jgi:hypothetical protein
MTLPTRTAMTAALAALLAACAAGPRPASDATAPYQLRGISVGRPSGEWLIAANTPTTLVLRKPAPAGAASFVMGITAVSGTQLDLGTPEGQRRAVEGMLVAGEAARYRITELKLVPQRRSGADCVTYEALVDEQSAERPGSSFLLTNQGFICRHPDSMTYYVAGAWSERRGRDQRPLLDPGLRGEAVQFLDSVRFTSL